MTNWKDLAKKKEESLDSVDEDITEPTTDTATDTMKMKDMVDEEGKDKPFKKLKDRIMGE